MNKNNYKLKEEQTVGSNQEMRSEIIVGPFPKIINREEKEEFLRHHGAIEVIHLLKKGKDLFAIAKFDSNKRCEMALRNIHQIEIFGRRINAKYYIPSSVRKFESFNIKSKSNSNNEIDKLQSALMKFESEICSINSKLGINHPIDPNLRYKYPSATSLVIANIAHALVAVPKFYTQVLHLMNKMNLPCPFGPLTGEPPLVKEAKSLTTILNVEVDNLKADSPKDEFSHMQESSDSITESELESDLETPSVRTETRVSVKRPVRRKAKSINKRPKLETLKQIASLPKQKISKDDDLPSLKEVFEVTSVNIKKPLNVKLPQEVSASISAESSEKLIVEEGFGKLHPLSKKSIPADSVEETAGKFITLEELNNNKIATSDWPIVPVFKNYTEGIPSTKLYVKNLARTVTEADLKFILGRFLSDDQSLDDPSSFSIRLMKEGRMKGQAFVTFPSTEIASKALENVNGFILKDKPMVIVYGKVKPQA